MSKEAKSYIQAAAWNRFPAQELWICPDNKFWAFDIDDTKITFTDGIYKDGDIIFHHTLYPLENDQSYLESLIKKKTSEGFECFAIQLRE